MIFTAEDIKSIILLLLVILFASGKGFQILAKLLRRMAEDV